MVKCRAENFFSYYHCTGYNKWTSGSSQEISLALQCKSSKKWRENAYKLQTIVHLARNKERQLVTLKFRHFIPYGEALQMLM